MSKDLDDAWQSRGDRRGDLALSSIGAFTNRDTLVCSALWEHFNHRVVSLRLVPHIPISEIGGLISAVNQGQSSIRAKQLPGFETRSCLALIEDWP